jgi:hypothetical protein
VTRVTEGPGYDDMNQWTPMFNLLVKQRSWGDGRDAMTAGRIFEYTDDALVARFKPGGQLDLTSLATLPSLFVQEGSGQQDQVARVGTITRARLSGGDVVLDYTYDLTIPSIPNTILQSFARDLDIEEFQFSRTHWSVKDQDLYRFLLRNAQPHRPRPKAFQLTEFENIEPRLVSAMMPFHPKFDAVYAILQRTTTTAGLLFRRADDIWENPAVIQDVVSLIDRSNVVICDCTGRNPNVFYEIGIAHALGREVILITQTEEDIPFDLRHLRFVRYLNNGEGLEALSTLLQPRLSELCGVMS